MRQFKSDKYGFQPPFSVARPQKTLRTAGSRLIVPRRKRHSLFIESCECERFLGFLRAHFSVARCMRGLDFLWFGGAKEWISETAIRGESIDSTRLGNVVLISDLFFLCTKFEKIIPQIEEETISLSSASVTNQFYELKL